MISEKNKGLILIAIGFLMIIILAIIPTPEALTSYQKYAGQLVIILALLAIVFGVQKIAPPRKIKHQGLFQIITGLLMFIAVAIRLHENWSYTGTFRLVIDTSILFFMIFLIIDGIRKEIVLLKS